MQAQAQAHTQKETLVRELQASLQRMAREKEELLGRAMEEQRRVESSAQTAEQRIQLQEQKLRTMQEAAQRAHEVHSASVRALDDANSRAAEQQRANAELGKQLLQFKEQIKYAHAARRTEAQTQSLVHQLQQDNARLVKILAGTNEYRDFIAFSEDSGGLTYIPPGGASGAAAAASAPSSGRPDSARLERAVRGAAREADYWVPSDAYSIANDFRHLHMPTLAMDHFAELLLRLNRVWKVRRPQPTSPTSSHPPQFHRPTVCLPPQCLVAPEAHASRHAGSGDQAARAGAEGGVAS